MKENVHQGCSEEKSYNCQNSKAKSSDRPKVPTLKVQND